MSQIKIVDTKPLYATSYMDVVQTTVTKDGKEHTHTNVLLTDSVFVLPVTAKNELYLVSQYRYLLGKNMTELVAGVLEEGEDPLAAAQRELREETGLDAHKWTKLGYVERGASFVKSGYHFYLAQDLEQKERHLDEFEDITVKKMPLAEAFAKLLSPEMNTSGTVLGLLLLDRLMKEDTL